SADLYYEGSLTIDKDLMEAADIIEFEKVHVVNINNGERFETYVIPGDRGSKVIGLNGAAARKGAAGDQVIIITYTALEDKELDKYKPIIILLDEKNEIKDIDNKVKEETIGMTNGN
ncbi:MAG: aspartate 1-decarboxylase, partial [Candidatus Kapaibacterium sp.]